MWLPGHEPAWRYCPFALYYMNPLEFRRPDLKKKVLGVKDIDGHTAAGIQLEFPLESLGIGAKDGFKGRPLVFEYYFDRENGRLLMSIVPEDYTTGRTVQTTYHDFGDADGIQIPREMIHFYDGRRGGQTNVISASFPETLDASLIAPTPKPAGK
jgi:hypothetical protein